MASKSKLPKSLIAFQKKLSAIAKKLNGVKPFRLDIKNKSLLKSSKVRKWIKDVEAQLNTPENIDKFHKDLMNKVLYGIQPNTPKTHQNKLSIEPQNLT
ncbi:MAG: hypothetical protein M0R34_00245 [Candidatus Marinimicrobia bacterium]|nr:hypothetical protein [Candidatus Neomarinimicrobiota bacterium]